MQFLTVVALFACLAMAYGVYIGSPYGYGGYNGYYGGYASPLAYSSAYHYQAPVVSAYASPYYGGLGYYGWKK